jgi:hypothetical protein
VLVIGLVQALLLTVQPVLAAVQPPVLTPAANKTLPQATPPSSEPVLEADGPTATQRVTATTGGTLTTDIAVAVRFSVYDKDGALAGFAETVVTFKPSQALTTRATQAQSSSGKQKFDHFVVWLNGVQPDATGQVTITLP